MRVAQRGTSTSSVSAGNIYAACDRWRNTGVTIGTWTISQSTDVPTGQGFSNSLKYDCTTAEASPAAGDQLHLSHRLEGQDLQQLKKGTANAEKVTLQFWVKSNKTGTYQVNIRDKDNTRMISQTYAISSSSTWEKKTLTFDGDTTGALDNDANNSLEIEWFLGAGSNYTSGAVPTSWEAESSVDRAAGINVNLGDSTSNEWYITGVQLEVGSQATPFEHRSFGEELALCQRYFRKIEVGNNIRVSNPAYADTTTRGRFVVHHNIKMRSTPTVTEVNLDLGGQDLSAIAAQGSTDLSDVICTRSSGTHSTGDMLQVHTGSNTAELKFESEL